MSTHFGGRTLARSQALQLLFQAEANFRAVLSVLDDDFALSEGPLDDYARRIALGVDEMRPDLDAVISMRSTGWSLSRMNGVDRNLLRMALYEMLFVDEVDQAVAIDECVELAKAYGTDESSRFVNGVLGRVADDLDAGVSGRQVYNDFYTGLFHDLPEVLTKDVISPIKESVSGLAAILEDYERDLVESTIMPLLMDGWRDEFRMMVFDPFSDTDDPVFGPRNGTDLKACDLMAAYMEANISRRYGISSNTLVEGERGIRDKLVEKGKGIGARALMDDLDRIRI